jgi:hypothetical protein
MTPKTLCLNGFQFFSDQALRLLFLRQLICQSELAMLP